MTPDEDAIEAAFQRGFFTGMESANVAPTPEARK